MGVRNRVSGSGLALLAGHLLAEEGTVLAIRPVMNFVGPDITATDDAANNRTNVTVTGAAVTTGWTDDGTVVRLTTATDRVSIGDATGLSAYKVSIVGDTGERNGLGVQPPAATDLVLAALLSGDTDPRVRIGNGTLLQALEFGPGNAAPDWSLSRNTGGNRADLGANDELSANGASGLLSVRAAVSDTNPTAALDSTRLRLGTNSADALSWVLAAIAANVAEMGSGDSLYSVGTANLGRRASSGDANFTVALTATGLEMGAGAGSAPDVALTRGGADLLDLVAGDSFRVLDGTVSVTDDDTTNNDVSNVATLVHTTSGVPAAGIGTGILMRAEGSGGNQDAARIAAVLTNVGAGTEASELRFSVRTGGAALALELILSAASLGPATDDGLGLGSGTVAWADLFLASGGVVNFANGDVTVTHSANVLAFAGASSGYTFADGPVTPVTNDAVALGTATVSWADLFLASGGVINWNNGDVTATHTANTLTFAGAASGYAFNDGGVTVTVDDATASGVTNLATIVHTTTGVPAAGIGAGLLFRAEGSGGTQDAAQLAGVLRNVGAAAEQGELQVFTRTGGGALAERWRFEGLGDLSMRGDFDFVPATDSQGQLGTATFRWLDMSAVTYRVFAASGNTNPTAALDSARLRLGVDSTDNLSWSLSVSVANRAAMGGGDILGASDGGAFHVRALAADTNPTARLSSTSLALGINSADNLSWTLTAQAASIAELGSGDFLYAVGAAGFGVRNASADANALYQVDNTGFRGGLGGVNALDVLLLRGAADRWELGGGDSLNTIGAGTIANRNLTGDTNPRMSLEFDRLFFGAGAGSGVDAGVRRSGAATLEVTGDAIPDIDGRNLGSATVRWDAFTRERYVEINHRTDADYTVAAGDYCVAFTTTLTAGRTCTLPDLASNRGRVLIIKNGQAGAFNITVTRAGADTIDGGTTVTLAPRESVTLFAPESGVDWMVV